MRWAPSAYYSLCNAPICCTFAYRYCASALPFSLLLLSFMKTTGRLMSSCECFDYFSSLSICCCVCSCLYVCICALLLCVFKFLKSIYPCNLFKLHFCFRFLIFPVLVISPYTYLAMYISSSLFFAL